MTGKRRTGIPIPAWLIIAVLLSVGLPIGAMAAAYAAATQHNRNSRAHAASRLSEARAVVGTDTAKWLSATWRGQATGSLNRLGAQVRLTRGGRTLLAAPPTFGGDAVKLDPATGSVSSFDRPHALAMLYVPDSNIDPKDPAVAAALIAALFAAITSVFIISRKVARPLAALQRAALDVSDGALDIDLPLHGAREINAVAEAFSHMGHELAAARRRQTELEHERRLFIAALVHDLRTPLFLLRGNLQALSRGPRASSRPPETYLLEAQAGADALEQLVDDLFTYTRLEYLDEPPRQEPVEIAGLLRAAITRTRPLAEQKTITLHARGPQIGCPTVGDPHLLKRAIQNLLENAVRHTPPGGRIDVTWARTQHTVSFSVRDSGPGFDPNDLPHLFTPLYRGKQARNQSTAGAGLGLAIAQRAVQTHNGSIEAHNDPNGGAVVRVTLPLSNST